MPPSKYANVLIGIIGFRWSHHQPPPPPPEPDEDHTFVVFPASAHPPVPASCPPTAATLQSASLKAGATFCRCTICSSPTTGSCSVGCSGSRCSSRSLSFLLISLMAFRRTISERRRDFSL